MSLLRPGGIKQHKPNQTFYLLMINDQLDDCDVVGDAADF